MANIQSSLRPLWKKFLLNQFHDVIPGSCIRKVAEDAMEIYQGWLGCNAHNYCVTIDFSHRLFWQPCV